MAGCFPSSRGACAVLLAAVSALVATPAAAQVLPWEIAVAEIEAGRIRNFAQRLSKQNILFQMHLGNVRKDDLIETAEQMDTVVERLRDGSPSYSIPAPWTPALREQVQNVDATWQALRTIAVADPYRYMSPDFAPAVNRGTDPLLLRYFDNLASQLIAESLVLLELYHEQCKKSGLGVCDPVRDSGYAAMIIERATKHAVFLVAGIDMENHRAGLKVTMEDYAKLRRANDANPFFAEVLNPERGVSASAAGELLISLRKDWDDLSVEFRMLAAGDEKNFDLRRMLEIQDRLVGKVERLSAAFVRYASRTYGS